MTEQSATATETILRLTDIRKVYGDHVALSGVSLDVKRGEVVAIIGPSGSGKSTLLRCVNQLEVPDSGTLEVLGSNIDFARRVSAADLIALRRKVGMVFQSFNLFPHMSVLRNVSFPQERVLGRGRDEADKVSRELLERVGLGDKMNNYPQKCSGGQQQRVAIARALALEPQIMLFDEPTSALDPELGLEVLAVMRTLADAGMTMVVVTHEIHFAAEVADRLVVMADGAIIEEGVPRELIASPSTQRAKQFLSAITDR
jgi:polar amino acid transport system ATP-binding protein